MPYSWTVGLTGSRFFIELRDNGKILANRCQECKRVWVPPRLRCPTCFREIEDEDWLEVGPEGTLRHFTVIHYEQPTHPLKPPFAYGIIDLDGADRAITHLIYDTELNDLRPRIRVRPVLNPQPQGSILDIAYFKPVGG